MSDAADSDGVLRTAGEGVGGFIAGIPSAISDFFGGVGEGAGVHGTFDWIALIIGLALLASAVRGLRRGRIVGPVVNGFLAVAFMGWAIA
jgi:hypothetical protein